MKVLLIDDHALYREGLCHVLKTLDENVCIFQAASYEYALQQIDLHSDLDLVLLDLNIPGEDGFMTLSTLVNKYPALPVVILSGSVLYNNIQRALDTGAIGYIPKSATSSVMLDALRKILSGETYVP